MVKKTASAARKIAVVDGSPGRVAPPSTTIEMPPTATSGRQYDTTAICTMIGSSRGASSTVAASSSAARLPQRKPHAASVMVTRKEPQYAEKPSSTSWPSTAPGDGTGV